MDAIKILKSRRSVRKYLDRTVPKKVLEDIVDCARLAATARNEQPWEFVVVCDPAVRAKLAGIAEYGKFITQAPACIAVFCKETKYYLEDGSAATQNILLAATAHGIGSCWVAGDKKPYADTVRELLGAPSGMKLISLVAIGYPAEQPHPKKRSLKEVIHWEKF
jgi:nitroreductase